jgi:hypothetical protein
MARAAGTSAATVRAVAALSCCVGGATFLPSNAAWASPVHFEIAEGTRLVDYTSTERRDDGAFFDRESGLLGGVSLGTAASWGAWRLDLAAAVEAGTLDYEGQTQLGLPIASHTRLQQTQLGLSPIYRIGHTPLFFGASLQSRRIDRRIEATPLAQGLHETLNQVELGPLVEARWEWGFGLGMVVRAEVLWSFHSALDVDFEGAFGNGHLSLPGNDAESAALEVTYAVFRDVAVAAEMAGETFRPARSPTMPLTEAGVPVGVYDYPGSVQDQWSVSLGVRTRF